MTIHTMLAAVNRYFPFLGKPDCRVKYLRVQHRLFRGAERYLTREEYLRLVQSAYAGGRERPGLLLEARDRCLRNFSVLRQLKRMEPALRAAPGIIQRRL